jgi:hypothetical protein
MSISARYRTLSADVRLLQKKIATGSQELPEQVDRELAKAAETLESLAEQVGEIPQFKLEKELTPVLIKAHGELDRARLLLEAADDEDNAERIWDMEQLVYRLLNEL